MYVAHVILIVMGPVNGFYFYNLLVGIFHQNEIRNYYE